jgi:hypothetical protein
VISLVKTHIRFRHNPFAQRLDRETGGSGYTLVKPMAMNVH